MFSFEFIQFLIVFSESCSVALFKLRNFILQVSKLLLILFSDLLLQVLDYIIFPRGSRSVFLAHTLHLRVQFFIFSLKFICLIPERLRQISLLYQVLTNLSIFSFQFRNIFLLLSQLILECCGILL